MARKPKLKISTRLLRKKTRRTTFTGAKQCRFCASKEALQSLDYKNSGMLRSFLTERGKILPLRISGNCSLHQRWLANEVKRSRIMALIPFAAYH
jgi:small subunit ribosomal protein S18